MLQRAASNAYTWWWASHIRTKQSKWLEQNVQDMEDKVKYTLKLIEEDGDSFARRAEMYYRKRPELINFVEESYRAYRALADRYDHLSGELQNANNTIASVFPEQVQFAMDDEDDDGSPKKPNSFTNENSIPKALPAPPKLNIPKIPSFRRKDAKDTSTLPTKKVQPKKASKGSQMKTAEALQKIDRLQKGILALQTEKEFVKSSFESGVEKYWAIEKQINEMQEEVCTLQDEFGVATVIEDDEARTIMAATALKSCQETLVQLQEKQEQSAEEARAEYQRIKDAHEKLQTIKKEFLGDQMDQPDLSEKKESMGSGSGLNNLEQEVDLRQEILRLESIQETIREHFDLSSDTFLTVTELAEKIDELVHEVISLETAVSSQNALIKRIRSETDELQENLRNLDGGKATLEKGPDKLTVELRKLDEKLTGIQDLHQSVEDQNNNLQTHFTETRCNLDHLSEKLHSVKPDEEIDIPVSSLADMGIVEAEKQKISKVQKDTVTPYDGLESTKARKEDAEREKSSVQNLSPSSKDNEEGIMQSMESNSAGDASEKCDDPEHQKIVEKQGTKDSIEKQEPSQTEDHIVDAHSQGICDLNNLSKELDSVQPGEEIMGSSMDKAEKQDLFPTENDDIIKVDSHKHSNLKDLSEKPHSVKSDSSMDNIENQNPSQTEDNVVNADSQRICDLNNLGKELHSAKPGEEILGSSMDKAEKQDLFPTGNDDILKVIHNDLSEKPNFANFGESVDTYDSSKDNIEKQEPSQTGDHIANADSQGWDLNLLTKEIHSVKPGEEIMGSSKGKAETQDLFPMNLNCNLNHLSEKQDSSQTDEVVKISPQAETGALIDDGMYEKFEGQEETMAFSDGPKNSKETKTEVEDKADEAQNSSLGVKNDEDGAPSKSSNTSDDNMPNVDSDQKAMEEEEEEVEGEPNWEKLFLSGLENREKVLLVEYTTILRNYKDTKKQLSEMEKRNQQTNFEMMVQLKELKRANATKDDEIKSLRQKLGFLQTSFEGNLETNNTEFKNTQQVNQQTVINLLDDQNVEAAVTIPNGAMETTPTTAAADEGEKIKAVLVDEPHVVATIEEKFRRDIDELLEENLEFWLRFSTLFHQIQKFQSSIQDLQTEITKLKDGKKEGSTSKSLKSDARPIYKHLREIQTELTVWLENNALLKEELQRRFTSLCDIQEEISRVSNAGSVTEEVKFTSYQAAKFHGEVLNMQQENNKVADELQAGLEHVRGLQHEIEKTLTKLNEDFELSGTKNNHSRNSSSRSRVPLRSFIFGVKNKKQRPSIFRCINPALQKQYSDLTAAQPP